MTNEEIGLKILSNDPFGKSMNGSHNDNDYGSYG
ncbi:hypothetical protein DERP_005003 [Dermatophagoides pteronyssinus]|uniref:Uncharacterized protein n=1 Tax=Dermatophagoides pteronyssinus TaxID=6956 RepID=A0ABQ8JTP1_DERPT|nr:hypothetical protein DERP_005003 [Dermatophagoides pteronyssinus]